MSISAAEKAIPTRKYLPMTARKSSAVSASIRAITSIGSSGRMMSFPQTKISPSAASGRVDSKPFAVTVSHGDSLCEYSIS